MFLPKLYYVKSQRMHLIFGLMGLYYIKCLPGKDLLKQLINN